MESIKHTNKEELIREHRLEESTNASDLSLLPERGIEEDVPDKIDQLDLHYVLLVCYDLVEHFEQEIHYVAYQLLAEDGVVDVVQEGLDQLDCRGVHAGVADVELDAHALDCVAFDVFYCEDDE